MESTLMHTYSEHCGDTNTIGTNICQVIDDGPYGPISVNCECEACEETGQL